MKCGYVVNNKLGYLRLTVCRSCVNRLAGRQDAQLHDRGQLAPGDGGSAGFVPGPSKEDEAPPEDQLVPEAGCHQEWL